MAGVYFEGVGELQAALSKLPRDLADAAREGHQQLAERTAAQIRANAPHPPGRSGEGSGLLASKVRTRYPSPFLADVEVGEEGETPYLGHYEFGTRHQQARPFVRPAAARTESAHESTMAAAARRRLK
jgi:HK97 gp10 family phage protein